MGKWSFVIRILMIRNLENMVLSIECSVISEAS